MERTTAIKRLQKRFGPKFMYRVADKPSSAEARAEHWQLFQQTKAEVEALNAREKEIIDAIPEIQDIRAKRRELIQTRERARGWASYYRYQVGTNMHGFAFAIEAQGDSWEDIFRKLEEKKQKDEQSGVRSQRLEVTK